MTRTATRQVLEHLHAHGGRCEYEDLLDGTDADPEAVHLATSLLQRDGYVYEPTEGTVGLV